MTQISFDPITNAVHPNTMVAEAANNRPSENEDLNSASETAAGAQGSALGDRNINNLNKTTKKKSKQNNAAQESSKEEPRRMSLAKGMSKKKTPIPQSIEAELWAVHSEKDVCHEVPTAAGE